MQDLKKNTESLSLMSVELDPRISKRREESLQKYILITRPEPAASKLAKELESHGFKTLIDPMLTITLCPEGILASLDKFQAVLVTSASAIKVLAMQNCNPDLPLWCVGDASITTARELGFYNSVTVPPHMPQNALSLAQYAQNSLSPNNGSILYLCGNVIQTDIGEILQTRGFEVQKSVVYTSEIATELKPETCEALNQEQLLAAIFYSGRTIDTFMNLCNRSNVSEKCQSIIALCLSQNIAEKAISWREAIVVPTINEIVGALNYYKEL